MGNGGGSYAGMTEKERQLEEESQEIMRARAAHQDRMEVEGRNEREDRQRALERENRRLHLEQQEIQRLKEQIQREMAELNAEVRRVVGRAMWDGT